MKTETKAFVSLSTGIASNIFAASLKAFLLACTSLLAFAPILAISLRSLCGLLLSGLEMSINVQSNLPKILKLL